LWRGRDRLLSICLELAGPNHRPAPELVAATGRRGRRHVDRPGASKRRGRGAFQWKRRQSHSWRDSHAAATAQRTPPKRCLCQSACLSACLPPCVLPRHQLLDVISEGGCECGVSAGPECRQRCFKRAVTPVSAECEGLGTGRSSTMNGTHATRMQSFGAAKASLFRAQQEGVATICPFRPMHRVAVGGQLISSWAGAPAMRHSWRC
jgi:hypothetical protein